MKKLALLFISFALAFAAYSTTEAKSHIGEYAEVCGKVYGVYHHRNGHLFLNLDGRYPHQKMTVVIWKEYVDNFDSIRFKNRRICVQGRIRCYKGKPEIFLKSRSQLKMQRGRR